MTEIIDRKKLTVNGDTFICTVCDLQIDVSSMLFDTDIRKKPQTKLAILLRREDEFLSIEDIPLQVVAPIDGEKSLIGQEPSLETDGNCVSCGGEIEKGYTSACLKLKPSEVTSNTMLDFSNSTICPFCTECAKDYIEAFEKTKSKSVNLTTHVI